MTSKKLFNIEKKFKELQKKKSFLSPFPFHDFWKMINIALFGDYIATKLHRAFSGHHAHLYSDGISTFRDIPNKEEAAIDWESARFTKPEKPLDAYDTWLKYYYDIPMEETLRKLGFWKGDK